MYEVDARGRRIGEIDMSGGLTTRLFDAAELHLEDACRMAYVQWWTCDEPFVRTLDDVKRIAVPGRKLFEELGCGDRQREILRRAGDRMAIIGDCISATLCFWCNCAAIRMRCSTWWSSRAGARAHGKGR